MDGYGQPSFLQINANSLGWFAIFSNIESKQYLYSKMMSDFTVLLSKLIYHVPCGR